MIIIKSTGVVRRIDELGRIVVPKEIRRVLRIREGDSLEISADTDAITLKKYSLVESINNFICQYVDALNASSKKEIIITDMEKVLAVSRGFKKSIIGRKIDQRLEDRILKRELLTYERSQNIEICDGLVVDSAIAIKPIMVYGDLIGCVCILGDVYISEIEKVLAELTAIFIGKYLES